MNSTLRQKETDKHSHRIGLYMVKHIENHMNGLLDVEMKSLNIKIKSLKVLVLQLK